MADMEVVNYTQMKPGNPRYDSLVEIAKREAEVKFTYNPSYRDAAYMDIDYDGQNTYTARVWRVTDDGRELIARTSSSPVRI